jgi:hypothetical protein
MSDANGMGDRRKGPRDPSTNSNLCGHWRGTNGDFHRNTRGARCAANVVEGTHECRGHSGVPAKQHKAKGAVVVELRRWGLTGHEELADPGETLLRLVTQSAARCELYARLLAEAYEAAERLREAERVPESDDLASETARRDLERVLNHGAVAALIGHRYAGTQTSGVIATGEAIRGLVELEAQERDRCAGFAAKAVAAGLAERQLRLAEQSAAMVVAAIEDVLSANGLDAKSPGTRAQVLDALTRLSGGHLVIEGSVAA